jgi:hypothetical protein
MTVESYLELYLALFGWLQYNNLWNVLTGTGLAYLPFLAILISNIIGPITSQETRDAATTSVKRMEVDLLIAFSVVVLAAVPAIDINAGVLRYTKPCDTASGPAGTFTPGSTDTSYDTAFSEVISTSVQVPVWWWGVMAVSSGINRQAIADMGCATDLAGFQMQLVKTKVRDPALANEINAFIQYCYRPAHAKFLRETPDVSALVAEFGPDDTEWMGANVFLQTPGYYDNPAFRPREPIAGWPYAPDRDTEYPEDALSQYDLVNIGRPLCNEWWSEASRGLRVKILNQVPADLLDSLRSVVPANFGGLTDTQVDDNIIKSVVTTALVSAPTGSALVPSLNEEGTLSLERLGAGLGLDWEELSFAPMMYVVRAALPIFQALILSGMYALLALALIASRYSLQGMVLLAVALFTVKFWSFLWYFAWWLEQHLIAALYPDGLSYLKANTAAFLGSTYLIGGDFFLKGQILDFATTLMYIVLPLIFSFMMGVVGVGAAVAVAGVVSVLRGPIQQGGRGAADTGRTVIQSVGTGKLSSGAK